MKSLLLPTLVCGSNDTPQETNRMYCCYQTTAGDGSCSRPSRKQRTVLGAGELWAGCRQWRLWNRFSVFWIVNACNVRKRGHVVSWCTSLPEVQNRRRMRGKRGEGWGGHGVMWEVWRWGWLAGKSEDRWQERWQCDWGAPVYEIKVWAEPQGNPRV